MTAKPLAGRWLAFTLAAGLGAALAACADDPAAGGADDELVIGTIMPMSGPQEALSNSYRSMQSYFDRINAAGGVDGVKIRLAVRDDQFNAVNTPAAARALVEQDGAQMLCANQGSATFKAIGDYLSAKQIGAVPMSGESSLFGSAGAGYQLLTPYEWTAASLVRHAVEELGMERVAIAYTEDGIGLPFRSGAEQALREAGLEPVAVVKVNAGAADQAPAAAKLKAADPQLVLLNHVAPVVSQLVRAGERVGLQATWGLTYATLNRQVLELSAGALDGQAIFATPFPDSSDEVLADYRAAMKADNPSVDATDFLSVEGWIAGAVCTDVVRRAVEAAQGKPSNQDLLQALGSTQLDTPLVRGLNWSDGTRLGSRDLRIVEPDGEAFQEVEDYRAAPDVSLGES